METESFDPVNAELRPGVSLIEANAGTGKTYAIAMLTVRMVVELDVAIDKILVVTFTKAAAEELKDRIRSRLAEARSQLTNIDHSQTLTPLLTRWLDRLKLVPDTVKYRLESALLDIDRAGIFTIHGFCQRVLSEHALASRQLFDAELTDDLAGIQLACADDFWRRQIQTRPLWETEVLTKGFKTPEALLNSVLNIHAGAYILPECPSLETALANLTQSAKAAANHVEFAIQAITPHLENQFFKTEYSQIFMANSALLSAWLSGETSQMPDNAVLAMFSRQGLLGSLNGTKFLKNKTHTSEERKNEFVNALKVNNSAFEDLLVAAETVSLALRICFLKELRATLDQRLDEMNVWTFDNLISHLATALQDQNSQGLTEELRQRFQAALIDEFQDTDALQWSIFSGVFANTPEHFLLLIGDPKQAIYKFRGADIYSYLSAQNHAQHRYTLTNNWRSHPWLVEGVNRLFSTQNAFLLPEIGYKPSTPALTLNDGELKVNKSAVAPIEIWHLPENAGNKDGHWQSGKAAEFIQAAVVSEISTLLGDSAALVEKESNRRVMPQDIAVLVRSNQQARDYQTALKLAGIPAVLTSNESVFGAEEARQLYILLDAVLHTGHVDKLTQALALDWFGLNGQRLYQLLHDDLEFGGYMARFVDYHQLWQQKGVMTMLQTLLEQESIVNVIAQSAFAERRLTNIFHLTELLQEAVLEEKLGLHKTLAWLRKSLTQAKANAENQQLRLESDADAVKIITMHRAKGLEYPIVFCPCLWQFNAMSKDRYATAQCHRLDAQGEYRMIADLGSPEFDTHYAQAQFEQKAEDVRLAYVAITRAKYRCYIAWADVRTKESVNQSALSWLLTLGAQDFHSQGKILQDLESEQPASFRYRLLDSADMPENTYQNLESASFLKAKTRHRSLLTDWQMSSYSALAALKLSEAPETPQDKADEPQYAATAVESLLPPGAQTGNVIHELLETIPFNELAQRKDFSLLISQACQRYGLRLSQPDIIAQLLARIVSTPLSADDSKFCLKNLADQHCLKELPFYLLLTSAQTGDINRILVDEPAFQPLSHKQMSGYLTGFVDLICEYNGRFYVMDYKTNSLPDYRPESLIEAMREHNYGLQYWLYCVVLHRYLQNRLREYSFDRHFGGVRYLFVRGMQPEIPMSGIFQDIPEFSKITALSGLLRGQNG